jgi:hypothetical protein
MIRNITFLLILIVGFSACKNLESSKNEQSNIHKNENSNIDTTSKKVDQTDVVSDTVKKIIDELNLCVYAENLNEGMGDIYDCYDNSVTDIRLIKEGDYNYDSFIFQSPGGSGGGTIIIYAKKNGKYEIVQEDYGYLIKVLKTTTNGYFDLIIWHRAQKAGGEDSLYKWDGWKYIKVKVIKNRNHYEE